MSNLVERLRSAAKKYREGTGAGIHEELDYQWSDKPHRHVYDLCRRLEEAANEIERLTAALAAVKEALSDVDYASLPNDFPEAKIAQIRMQTLQERTLEGLALIGKVEALTAALASAETKGWNAAIEAAANAMNPMLRSMLSRTEAYNTIRAIEYPGATDER